MAKGYKADSERLKQSFLEQAEELWDKCDKVFFGALDESDSKRLKINFGASLNLKEREFVVDVDIAFKDKTEEGGLEVNKTFHASKRAKLPDPDQPELPGAEKPETKDKKKGGKKGGGGEEPPAQE